MSFTRGGGGWVDKGKRRGKGIRRVRGGMQGVT